VIATHDDDFVDACATRVVKVDSGRTLSPGRAL
jgi:hypothetical protein